MSFPERVLPTLQRIRAARKASDDLIRENHSPVSVNAGRFALETLHTIDKSLRATGVYELSQLEILDNDSSITEEVGLVIREVMWRLRNLARNIYLRTEQSGDPAQLQHIAGLTAALTGTLEAATA